VNKPKRYGADGDPKWDGCFVEWEEYAKLSVELRRLRASSFVTNVPSEDFEKLETENARLKAEVERLKEGNECLDQMHEKEMARSAFLCEEVNRTTSWGRGLESDLSWARAELLMVKAEVERLEHQVKYWRIEAEVDNARWLRCLQDLEELRALSFVTAVPSEQYEKTKAEVNRLAHRCSALREAGDDLWYCIRHRDFDPEATATWQEVRDDLPK